MKNNIFLLIALLLFAACQKQPTANFNTDKTTYYAGETIHCTDASTNAHHWLWTMPNGSTYTTQNVDYVIDTNDIGGDKTITLETTSKNGKKTSTFIKMVTVNQYILPSDFFSINSKNHLINYKPISKTTTLENNNWKVDALETYEGPGFTGINKVSFFLLGNSPPLSSGIYNLKSDKNNLSSSESTISYTTGDGDTGLRYYSSTSGQLNISIANKSKVRLRCSNILATNIYSPSDTIRISTDITER